MGNSSFNCIRCWWTVQEIILGRTMRILNRPMFKYGGPIKEGIMHGMKNGGNVGAFNVGSPVKGMFPKDATGREHHVGPGLLALPWIGAGLRMAARPFGSWAMKNIPKMFSGPQRKFVIGKGWQSTPGYTGNVAQNVFTPTKFGKYLAGSPEGRLVTVSYTHLTLPTILRV